MTLYAESSAVLRWLFNEAAGEQVLTHLQDASKVVCSRLTLIECRRVVRRGVSDHRIREVEATELSTVLGEAAARWATLEIYRDVAERAEGSFPVEPIRTLDAIHLASALTLRHSLPDLVLLSTDTRVRANGEALGFHLLPQL